MVTTNSHTSIIMVLHTYSLQVPCIFSTDYWDHREVFPVNNGIDAEDENVQDYQDKYTNTQHPVMNSLQEIKDIHPWIQLYCIAYPFNSSRHSIVENVEYSSHLHDNCAKTQWVSKGGQPRIDLHNVMRTQNNKWQDSNLMWCTQWNNLTLQRIEMVLGSVAGTMKK